MYAESTRPSAKREVQKERSAKRDVQKFWSSKRDDRIARPRRAQTCERSARWECAREAGRFILMASYQILKNYKILINHESFFQRNTIKKHFPIWNFYKQIAQFDNNLLIFETWKWLSCRESFSRKSDL